MAYIVPTRDRPAGITALTILQIIAGIIDILVGFLLLLAFQQPGSFAASLIGIPSTYRLLLPPIAVVWFTFGILACILAGGVWKGKGWALLLSIIFASNALILGVFGLLLGSLLVAVPLAVYALILIFLSLSKVRAYCSRTYMPAPFIFPPVQPAWIAAPPVPAPPAYGRPTYGSTVQQSYYPKPPPAPQQPSAWRTAGTCPSCGTPLQSDASYCFICGIRFR